MKRFVITGIFLMVSEAGADRSLHTSADDGRRAVRQHGQPRERQRHGLHCQLIDHVGRLWGGLVEEYEVLH
jgi:hypothetical protein